MKFVKSVAGLFCFLLFVPALPAQSTDNILLLINENSSRSKEIGRYYAEKRNLPESQICRLHTAESETIKRDAFESEILRPVTEHLKSKALQDQILYLVTTQGLPLVIERDPVISLDSELTLAYRYMLAGTIEFGMRVENPYFTPEFRADSFRPFVRRNNDIYLVTRLTAQSLIDRSFSASPGGGFYFDLASPQQSTETDWVRKAASILKESKLPVTLDDSAKVLDHLKDVQGYLSQGSNDVDIEWKPGAITAVLDRNENWEGESRYVASGVTGLGGYIADPWMDGLFRPQVLFPAYAAGYNLAEAFSAASRYLAWRQVVIGDPLTMPYSAYSAKRKEMAAEFHPGNDSETGLPEYFARRRLDFLLRKYSTSRDALVLLLKAEASSYRGDRKGAVALIEQSLTLDPFVVESQLLKQKLQDRKAPYFMADIKEPRNEVVLEIASAQDEPAVVSEIPAPAPTRASVPARPYYRTAIEYPNDARFENLQGKVVVSLLIDEMGQVMGGDIVSGPRLLAEAAIKAAKSWRFTPALENGRPVESRFLLPVTFNLTRPKTK